MFLKIPSDTVCDEQLTIASGDDCQKILGQLGTTWAEVISTETLNHRQTKSFPGCYIDIEHDGKVYFNSNTENTEAYMYGKNEHNRSYLAICNSGKST